MSRPAFEAFEHTTYVVGKGIYPHSSVSSRHLLDAVTCSPGALLELGRRADIKAEQEGGSYAPAMFWYQLTAAAAPKDSRYVALAQHAIDNLAGVHDPAETVEPQSLAKGLVENGIGQSPDSERIEKMMASFIGASHEFLNKGGEGLAKSVLAALRTADGPQQETTGAVSSLMGIVQARRPQDSGSTPVNYFLKALFAPPAAMPI